MATQTTTVVASKKWSIDWRDLVNGAIMAVIGAVGGQIVDIAAQWITQPGWAIDFHLISPTIKGAIVAIISYLIKKFADKSKIIITNPPEQIVAAVKEGADVKIAGATIPGKNTTA